MSITAEELAPRREGILANVRTRDGRTPTGKLTPDMVLMVGKVPVPLKMAEAEGIVRGNAQGEYEEVDQAERLAAQDQQRQGAEAQIKAEASFPEPMIADSSEFLSDLHRAMTANGVSPDAAILTAYTNPERFIEQVLPKIVAQGGDSAAVMEGIGAAFEETQRSVASLCVAEGVNADAFFQYLESGRISRSRWLSAGLQALGGEARPFRAIIREFKSIGRFETRGTEVPRGPRRPGE